jgi:YihY family inner membrane protein
MELIERSTRALEAAQRRHRPTAFAVGVIRKYSDDRGGQLAALVTFYGFLAVFPLLLLFVTIVSIVVGPHSHAEKEIVDSALSQFPVIGTTLRANIHALSKGQPLSFVVSFVFLLWGSLGITNALQNASARMWHVPRRSRPNLWVRIGRGLALLGIIAGAVVGSSVLAGISAFAPGHLGGHAVQIIAIAAAAVVNMVCYLVALWILAPDDVRWRSLAPGMLVGGVGWTVLQAIGGYLIAHHLHRATELYGFFAIVLGLVFWLNLGSQLFLYSTEINVVGIRRLWPRRLFGTDASPEEAARSGVPDDVAIDADATAAGSTDSRTDEPADPVPRPRSSGEPTG